MMAENASDWQTAMQVEQYRAAQVTTTMQAIKGVPVFDGKSVDLEFFIKSMDAIVQQVNKSHLDETFTNYVQGFFYSRITPAVLAEIGAGFDTPWEQVKLGLRERFGGLGRTLPRLTLREVLINRAEGQDLTEYVREVATGVRKVKARIRDTYTCPEEIRARCVMLEELAVEMIQQNLPRRVKQWVRVAKPTDLAGLVKVVEEEELEERDERRREPQRRVPKERKFVEWRKDTRNQSPAWQTVRGTARRRPAEPRYEGRRGAEGRGNERPDRRTRTGDRKPRQCWECREEGHFARECPYVYRREQKRVWRGEPMEVNHIRRQRRRWFSSDRESDSEESSCSRTSSGREKEEWPELKKNAVRKDITPEINEA